MAIIYIDKTKTLDEIESILEPIRQRRVHLRIALERASIVAAAASDEVLKRKVTRKRDQLAKTLVQLDKHLEKAKDLLAELRVLDFEVSGDVDELEVYEDENR